MKYIQIDVYQPKRYLVTMNMVCEWKVVEENSYSEIIRVANGENFNTFLNDMPVRFMLGTNSDTTAATVANTSKFYKSKAVYVPTDKNICGWFGVHQEDSYQFGKQDLLTLERNQIVWEDFVEINNSIKDTISKLRIIKYKFTTMFSLSDAVYRSYELYFRAVGGTQPALYRSVTPTYENSSTMRSTYQLDDMNMATVPEKFPNIVGVNYSGHTDGVDDEVLPMFNRYYNGDDDKDKYMGNYFAAFSKYGGYVNNKKINPKEKASMRSPNYASVSPCSSNRLKEIGKVMTGDIYADFRVAYDEDTQQLPDDIRRNTKPYLRALTVDRRLDFDLTFIAPVIGSSFNIYPIENIENENRDTINKNRPWKSARIFGSIYGGIEMSYDSYYNIISATTYNDDSGNIISVGKNNFLEYTYEISQGDTDAKTTYNKPTEVFWERDLVNGEPPTDKTMNKRFYEASLCGIDIRDYLWSTFNKTRLNDHIISTQGSGYTALYSTPLPCSARSQAS
jgi:hypothetical protein